MSQPTINSRQRFSAEALEAMKEFRRGKPWRGSMEERRKKLLALHQRMQQVYGLDCLLEFRPARYLAAWDGHAMYLGHPSVVSYLFLLARARELRPREAFVWAITLFARIFPRSWERCEVVGSPRRGYGVVCHSRRGDGDV